jgi:DNA-binding transcriptional MerR regulator
MSTSTDPEQGLFRIGTLAKRTGVSADLLRAWERRYGILRPSRTEGRYRLYSESDVDRVLLMKGYTEAGMSASDAARLTANLPGSSPIGPGSVIDARRSALRQALLDLDDAGANAAFDALLADLSIETVLSDVVLPILREVGEGWVAGDLDISQEHFASSILRGRLLGLARGWGAPLPRTVLLACAPGELHDIGLICFGIAAWRRGFAVTFLGQDTPVASVTRAAEAIDPTVVVVLGLIPERFSAHLEALQDLARVAPLCVAGAGATQQIADAVGGTLMHRDPVTEATLLGAA